MSSAPSVKSRRFKPGDLAWITSRQPDYHVMGFFPTETGYPTSGVLTRGVACTVIRQAIADDYGELKRIKHGNNVSTMGEVYARGDWLVLYEGKPILVENENLVTRPCNRRKVVV